MYLKIIKNKNSMKKNKKLTREIYHPISDEEKQEEIEYIWIVVANMNGRAPLLAVQTIVGLIPLIGLVSCIFPRCEHHGIVFKTKNGNYYSSDFGAGRSKFLNFHENKKKAFNFIAFNVRQKDFWILLKATIKDDENIQINELINLMDGATPKEYHLIFNNCQNYVRNIMEKIYDKIKIIGYDSGWTPGHMNAGIVMWGDRSY